MRVSREDLFLRMVTSFVRLDFLGGGWIVAMFTVFIEPGMEFNDWLAMRTCIGFEAIAQASASANCCSYSGKPLNLLLAAFRACKLHLCRTKTFADWSLCNDFPTKRQRAQSALRLVVYPRTTWILPWMSFARKGVMSQAPISQVQGLSQDLSCPKLVHKEKFRFW